MGHASGQFGSIPIEDDGVVHQQAGDSEGDAEREEKGHGGWCGDDAPLGVVGRVEKHLFFFGSGGEIWSWSGMR